MSWSLRRAAREAQPPPPAAAPAPPAPQHSLGLASVLGQLPAEGQPAVLDLGPAIGGNVDFLRARGCRLHIADLFASLPATAAWSEPEGDVAALPAGLLPAAGTFDLVLAWDLLDYLTLPQMRGVARALAHCSRRGTLLFALVSTHKQMPARPRRYRMVAHDQLLYEDGARGPAAGPQRPCPRHHQPDLERGLPNFIVATSYLLRTGVQEYLFAHR